MNQGRIPKAERTSPQRVYPKSMNGNSIRGGIQIEEVPNVPYNNEHAVQPQLYEDERLPMFLIKLWNIIEDPLIQSIVHWDESGASFHIANPQAFCHDVLPHYFKHNNLNSLIRQLNMYGFKKITPLNQGGLTRTMSDQDHLEFSHPFFVQGQPGLLGNIRRKQSTRTSEDKQVSAQTQQNLEMVMSELRAMREKQRSMEVKMSQLTKENESMWSEMQTMRQQSTRQQHIVNKLVQFLVALVQPNMSKRVGKRGVLAIDEYSSPPKRSRQDGNVPSSSSGSGLNSLNQHNINDLNSILDGLQRHLVDSGGLYRGRMQDAGPVIAEVTDEMGNSPLSGSRFSRESSPQPIITTGTSGRASYASGLDRMGGSVGAGNSSGAGSSGMPTVQSPGLDRASPEMYTGSGAYTLDMALRGKNSQQRAQTGQKRNNRGQPSNASYVRPSPSNSQFVTPSVGQMNGQSQYLSIDDGKQKSDPNLNMHSNVDRSDTFSPTITMSPSLERQISQELQDYLSSSDISIGNCRDLLALTNNDWPDIDLDDYLDDGHNNPFHPVFGGQQLALEHLPHGNPLELEYIPGACSPQNVVQDGEIPAENVANGVLLDDLVHDAFPMIPDQEHLDQFPSPEHLMPSSSPGV